MLVGSTARRVAIVGGVRIPFARSYTAYATASNQDMLTATFRALVERYRLQGERLGDVAAGAVMSTSKSSEHNIISATSPGSSIPGSWSDTFELVYFWNQTAGRPNVAVMEAVLSVIFFGATISSRTEVENPPITTSPGTITLNASFGQYQYLFGGLFAMTASLVASNGSTAWGQSFYVTIGQPWDITVVSGILIAIALYEIYAIITCGKGERRVKAKPTLAQPAPAASPPSETAPPMTSAPGTGGEPYPSESPPPPGGS